MGKPSSTHGGLESFAALLTQAEFVGKIKKLALLGTQDGRWVRRFSELSGHRLKSLKVIHFVHSNLFGLNDPRVGQPSEQKWCVDLEDNFPVFHHTTLDCPAAGDNDYEAFPGFEEPADYTEFDEQAMIETSEDQAAEEMLTSFRASKEEKMSLQSPEGSEDSFGGVSTEEDIPQSTKEWHTSCLKPTASPVINNNFPVKLPLPIKHRNCIDLSLDYDKEQKPRSPSVLMPKDSQSRSPRLGHDTKARKAKFEQVDRDSSSSSSSDEWDSNDYDRHILDQRQIPTAYAPTTSDQNNSDESRCPRATTQEASSSAVSKQSGEEVQRVLRYCVR